MVAYRLDPCAVVRRAAKVAADRFVSSRPAPDTMCSVYALLPVVDGVAVQAALAAAAERARCAGDRRSRGQVMADTLVGRVTGHRASHAPAGAPGTPDTDTTADTTDDTAAGHTYTSMAPPPPGTDT